MRGLEGHNGAWPYETVGNALCRVASWPGWILPGSSCSPEGKKKRCQEVMSLICYFFNNGTSPLSPHQLTHTHTHLCNLPKGIVAGRLTTNIYVKNYVCSHVSSKIGILEILWAAVCVHDPLALSATRGWKVGKAG